MKQVMKEEQTQGDVKEEDIAIWMANKALDVPNADPDDDLRTISRHFLRAIERQENQNYWHNAFKELSKSHVGQGNKIREYELELQSLRDQLAAKEYDYKTVCICRDGLVESTQAKDKELQQRDETIKELKWHIEGALLYQTSEYNLPEDWYVKAKRLIED